MTIEEAIKFGNNWLDKHESSEDRNLHNFFVKSVYSMEKDISKNKAEWEVSKYEFYRTCSHCKNDIYESNARIFTFCPYCGYSMRVLSEEELYGTNNHSTKY